VSNTTTIATEDSQGKTKGPFVFFTVPGLLSIVGACVLFVVALAKASAFLLIFSLIITALLILMIFLTHENITGLDIKSLRHDVDLESGRAVVVLSLSNTSSSSRYLLRLTLHGLGQTSRPLSANVPSLGPRQQVDVVLPLPWCSEVQNQLQVTRILLESRFPCGMIRTWKVLARRGGDALKSFDLAPHPMAPGLDRAPEDASHEDWPLDALRPYRNESPSRIDWMSTLRTGTLLARPTDDPSQEPLTQHTPKEDLIWQTKENHGTSWLFFEALINFRQGRPFRVHAHAGQVLFSWSPTETSVARGLCGLLALMASPMQMDKHP
jgi:hypothetical protein